MITAEKFHKDRHHSYPENAPCICGKKAKLKYNDLSTRYNNENITIKNTPYYECSSGHMKTARVTKVKIKKLLKKAFENKQNKIDFENTI